MKKMTFHGVHDIGKTNNINKILIITGILVYFLALSWKFYTAEISSGQIPHIIFSMETGVSESTKLFLGRKFYHNACT